MATIKTSNIIDQKSFGAWLYARPEILRRQEVVLLYSRDALRILPLLQRRDRLDDRQYEFVLRNTFWCHAISRVAGTYPNSEIVAAANATGAILANLAGDYSTHFAAFDFINATYAAAIATNTAYVPVTTGLLPGADISTSPHGPIDLWADVLRDAQEIELSSEPINLAVQALWIEAPPAWWREEWNGFSKILNSPEMKAGGWDIWADWYDCIAFRRPLFGITNPKLRDELERNIALGSTDGKFNEEFWQREPSLINADVKRWVEDAQLVDATREGQGSGLKFEISNGIVKLFSGLGLASPDSDHARINAQLPFLREIVAA